jgi:hypothetical protein
MAEGELLDDYAGKISGMAARYASLGSTLGEDAMVKKLLDTVPDRLYSAVAGIEQFCDMETMAFEEALGRLKTIEERSRWRAQAGDERNDGQLLLTEQLCCPVTTIRIRIQILRYTDTSIFQKHGYGDMAVYIYNKHY